MNETDFQVKLT